MGTRFLLLLLATALSGQCADERWDWDESVLLGDWDDLDDFDDFGRFWEFQDSDEWGNAQNDYDESGDFDEFAKVTDFDDFDELEKSESDTDFQYESEGDTPTSGVEEQWVTLEEAETMSDADGGSETVVNTTSPQAAESSPEFPPSATEVAAQTTAFSGQEESAVLVVLVMFTGTFLAVFLIYSLLSRRGRRKTLEAGAGQPRGQEEVSRLLKPRGAL